jgi:S-formylglutathione hydrolase FrmB
MARYLRQAVARRAEVTAHARALLIVAVAAFAAFVAPAAATTFRDAAGIHVLSVRRLDSRLLTITVSTPALSGPANVRVLLPSDYAAQPGVRYPVLYLLHGTSGGASDWTTKGDAEQTTSGRPLIVVMPDIALHDDGGGWCTNWYNGGAYGRPKWETFHIDQLIPWVDANLRTITERAGRAIAGLSQGGFCSMSYAARRPDLFAVALSYSGAPDIAYDLEAQALVTPIINGTELGLDHVAPNSMFGPRPSEEINWAAHDPATLAENLRDTRLFLYTGNGQPGPLDTQPNIGASLIEGGVEQLTKLFHARLRSLGIPSLFDDYGPGTHSWPYWARDLRESIGPLMADFARPVPPPARVTYTAAERSYSIYGWSVTMHRAVEELSTLGSAAQNGFVLSGSGNGIVVTPPVYTPGALYAITIASRFGTRGLGQAAGADGRLRIDVPLGPTDRVQEYPLDGPPLGTTVYTTRVRIAPAARSDVRLSDRRWVGVGGKW